MLYKFKNISNHLTSLLQISKNVQYVSLFWLDHGPTTCSVWFCLSKAVPAALLQSSPTLSSIFSQSVARFSADSNSCTTSIESHCKYTQGAGLVFQAQDAVCNSLQVAGQSYANVLDIPVKKKAIQI